MNKQKELDKIAEEIGSCKVCKIGKSGKAVVGEGNPEADIVFIGEAPGRNEALKGRPFVGRSGKLLRLKISDLGFKEEKVYITSPVKYLPNRGTPTGEDIKHGKIHLDKQLKIISPKIVVLLGRVAAEGVLGQRVFVMKEHGEIIEEIDGVKYFLTLHPSAVLRFAKYTPLFEEDFRKLKRIIKII